MISARMTDVLEKLPLSDELVSALLDGTGPLGDALKTTLAYELGDWANVGCLGLDRSVIKQAFLDAVAWVDVVDSEISASAA